MELNIRRLWVQVERHTRESRERWRMATGSRDWEFGRKPKVWGMNVLLEEVGKLSRCINKLAIADDPDIREKWNKEAKHRLMTIMSMSRRLYESWDELPDSLKGENE